MGVSRVVGCDVAKTYSTNIGTMVGVGMRHGTETAVVKVETIDTRELGDRSYVAHDGHVAIVVDPQRDVDRVEALLDDLGLECALVLETHIHNDYVTGGLALTERVGANYCVAASDVVDFARHAVADGDELVAGRLRIQVVATPGHTDGHVAYVVGDEQGPSVLFSGGSLLYGSVGRTDLVNPARTDELTRAQYRSTRHLADLLDDDTPIFPTHGFGSFCSSGDATGDDSSTIGRERARNGALTAADEDAFVAALIAGLSAYPSYYVHMGPLNREGPGPADLAPPTAISAAELVERIASGQWVVDVRIQRAFAAAHVAGTVGIALGDQFSTYLGWLMPWGAPLTLLAEDAGAIASAQRQLFRIGIEHPDAVVGAVGELAPDGDVRTYPVATFAELERMDNPVVLDVRRDDEYAAAHLPGALHVPLDELEGRLAELPRTRLFVHCASGYRASIAASLLDRVGHDVVLIDDDFANAAPTGRTG